MTSERVKAHYVGVSEWRRLGAIDKSRNIARGLDQLLTHPVPRVLQSGYGEGSVLECFRSDLGVGHRWQLPRGSGWRWSTGTPRLLAGRAISHVTALVPKARASSGRFRPPRRAGSSSWEPARSICHGAAANGRVHDQRRQPASNAAIARAWVRRTRRRRNRMCRVPPSSQLPWITAT
jgi:hypothetical protein